MHARKLFWEGYLAALPLMIGVVPFGIVFGALAVSAGMSTLQALGMSVFVIAGSSQFVAAGLIKDNAPFVVIILTTFIINLRHLLYSTSLASYLRPLSTPWKMFIGYLMIDEVYAPAWQRYKKGDLTPQELRWYFIGGGVNLASLWWSSTVVGALVGEVLPEKTTDQLGFTLPLIFTAIVMGMLNVRSTWVAALSAAAAGIFFAPLPNNLGLIVAAIVGIGVGVMSEKR